jgi:hypothetical protein
MPLPAKKDRNEPSREIKPIPISRIIFKYFIEIIIAFFALVFCGIVVFYQPKVSNDVLAQNSFQILLLLLGGLVGRITSK